MILNDSQMSKFVLQECGSSVQNIECNSDLMTSEEEHSLVALKELTIALKQ